MQKELIYDEQDKIQNIQLQEIAKLKGLLNFREQEAVDQLAQIKQHQQQVDALKAETQRLRLLESQHDDIQVRTGGGDVCVCVCVGLLCGSLLCVLFVTFLSVVFRDITDFEEVVVDLDEIQQRIPFLCLVYGAGPIFVRYYLYF